MDAYSIDFETRSAAEIKTVSAWRYAEDPTTEVMCLAWHRVGSDAPVQLWAPGQPVPEELLDAIRAGAKLRAWNAGFEQAIWHWVMVKQHGWPEPKPDQWECTMSWALSYALPRALDQASEALHLPYRKDAQGHALMLKMSKPRKPTKKAGDWARVIELTGKEPPKAVWGDMFGLIAWISENGGRDAPLIPGEPLYPWHCDPDDLQRLYEYCRQDVRVEEAVAGQLKPLSPREYKVWLIDQEMNRLGVHIDTELARKAIDLTKEVVQQTSADLKELTRGEVTSVRQFAKLRHWLNARLDEIDPKRRRFTRFPGVSKEVVRDWLLEHGDDPALSDTILDALELRQRAAKSSATKFKAMLKRVRADGTVADTCVYHGAGTGRWAGSGLQVQNFPTARDLPKGTSMDLLCDLVLQSECAGDIETFFESPMSVLSGATRGAIVAPPGCDFIAADYNAIEARGLSWITDDEPALEVFRDADSWTPDCGREKTDIYIEQAKAIPGADRPFGKIVILGCGYQMGWDTFVDHCAKDGVKITPKRSQEVIKAYRSKHPAVVDFWSDINDAALEAVRRGRGGKVVEFGRLRMAWRGQFFIIQLPSMRRLRYHMPRIYERRVEYKCGTCLGTGRVEIAEDRTALCPEDDCVQGRREFTKRTLSYMRQDSQTKKWRREFTYGGKLTENVVQAIARDLLADALVRIKSRAPKYQPRMTVHDEIVASVRKGQGNVTEFENLIAELPEWADGFPVQAEGWIGRRFRK